MLTHRTTRIAYCNCKYNYTIMKTNKSLCMFGPDMQSVTCPDTNNQSLEPVGSNRHQCPELYRIRTYSTHRHWFVPVIPYHSECTPHKAEEPAAGTGSPFVRTHLPNTLASHMNPVSTAHPSTRTIGRTAGAKIDPKFTA